MATNQPLIVVVGPTASGKTALSINIAKEYGGEIICADSRTVFREMNIGTAKPTEAERAMVPHWGLDLARPGDRYTAAAFKDYANLKVSEIRSRGRTPIITGGTGLYVDGIIFDYVYPQEPSLEVKRQFEAMSSDELHRYCIENGLELPVNDKNRRHLIRAVMQGSEPNNRRETIEANTHVFGVAIRSDVLVTRIHNRTEQMFEDGIVEEAKMLGNKYGWDSEAMTGNVYPLIRAYLEGRVTHQEVIDMFEIRDRQLAKRQMTWFRRNPFISWGTGEDIQHQVGQLFTSE